MYDLSKGADWLNQFLTTYMSPWLAVVVECVIIGVVLLLAYALLALFYIYFERKVCAAFQCRLGPNRVGPFGTPYVDQAGLKLTDIHLPLSP